MTYPQQGQHPCPDWQQAASLYLTLAMNCSQLHYGGSVSGNNARGWAVVLTSSFNISSIFVSMKPYVYDLSARRGPEAGSTAYLAPGHPCYDP